MDFSALFAFARHTRQSEDETRNVTKLAQKWLAIHTAPLVYAQVASDYALLALRTHSPPLQSYAAGGFDVPTFVAVLKTGLQSNEPIDATAVGPAFAQFCEAIFPTPAGEEKWEKFTRNDHWKKAGYFLAAAQRPTQFYPLVEAVYFSDLASSNGGQKPTRAQLDDMADLATRITRYTSQHMKEGSVSPKELGNLISMIKMPPVVVINHVAAAAEVDDEEEHERESVHLHNEAQIHFVSSSSSAAAKDDAVRKNEAAQAYRKSAGLNVTFSSQKLAKQIVLAALGLTGKEGMCEPLLAKQQEAFVSLATAPQKSDWDVLLSEAITCDPSMSLDLKDPALVAFFLAKPSENARAFLRDVVLFRLGQEVEGIDERFKKRHLKIYPDTPESVIKAIALL